jgi:hypothetical protein
MSQLLDKQITEFDKKELKVRKLEMSMMNT